VTVRSGAGPVTAVAIMFLPDEQDDTPGLLTFS